MEAGKTPDDEAQHLYMARSVYRFADGTEAVMPCWKIGFHTGTRHKLKQRYCTAYTNDMELETFRCPHGNGRALEAVAHALLRRSRVGRGRNEIYDARVATQTERYRDVLSRLSTMTTEEARSLVLVSASSPSQVTRPTAEVMLAAAAGAVEAGNEPLLRYVEQYNAVWGVDRIDAAFLEANGTELSSPKVRLLARMLCPDMPPQQDADRSLSDGSGIFKVPRIEEVLEGLGLESAFDDETSIGDLMAAFDARLRDSEMFRHYERTARLFQHEGPACDAVTGDVEWDLSKIVRAVNKVLGAVGLGLVKDKRTRVLTYRLDPEAVASMVELVKLRLRVVAAPALVENPHARARVEACTLPRYGHLVDADRSSCMFLDVSDQGLRPLATQNPMLPPTP